MKLTEADAFDRCLYSNVYIMSTKLNYAEFILQIFGSVLLILSVECRLF